MIQYPGILIPDFKCEKLDKDKTFLQYVLYFLSQTQKMFECSITQNGEHIRAAEKFTEIYLQQFGVCAFEIVEDELTALKGGWGGERDKNYRPKQFTIANPYIPEQYNGTKTIGEDCEIILNDSFAQGLIPIISKYSQLLTENDVTLRIASIMARVQAVFSAADDDTKASADKFIKDLFDGELSVIGESPFLNDLKVSPISAATSGKIKELIELTQYYFATAENRLGLQSNYNMKRERLNTAETALNEDVLYPFVQNMLDERKLGAERVKAYCDRVRPDLNIEISFELGSSWQDNFRQKDAELENVEQDDEPGDEVKENEQMQND